MSDAAALALRLVPYVVPPLLGAVIGYVTNALAIRMLFRPLTEKRVFGVRLPLTPGIIPKQRHQLAHSIARMVSTKLLTDEVLLAKLREPSFGDSIYRSVSGFTTSVLDGGTQEGTAAGDDPGAPAETQGDAGPLSPEAIEAREEVSELARTLLQGFFVSDAFRQLARRVVEAAIGGALELPVDRLVPQRDRFDELVRKALSSVADGVPASAVIAAVERWVGAHAARDTPVRDVTGERLLERLDGLLERVYDPLLAALLEFLRRPSTRDELAIQGRELVQSILRRLNVVQRFLVSATQYDRSLNENMPAIVDDLIGSIERAGRDPAHRRRILTAIRRRVSRWADTGVGTLAREFGIDAAPAAGHLAASALGLLGRSDVEDRIVEALHRFVDERRDLRVEDVIRSLFGVGSDDLVPQACSVVDRWLDRPGTPESIAARVVEFGLRYLGSGWRGPLRGILPVTEAQKERVDRFLTDRIRRQLEERVPQIVAGLDIYGMVVARIDGLDMESVEQLLLMVIARHLKWINLFGALIGALIGATQVLIGLLT